MSIVEKLGVHPPRYGPEWGSGGIFGLKYNRGVLYYTVAFEAEAHFIRDDEERVYKFDKVGSLPTSGGDTYNASEVVDEFIYFGGWVHAPAVYEGKSDGRSTIAFFNKFSHLHSYDTENDKIGLLWKESMHDKEKWVGEISNILYDPVGDRLLLSRLDGHQNLGVYSIDRDGKNFNKLSDLPSLKGTLVEEYACFDISASYLSLTSMEGFKGIQALDLTSNSWEKFEIKNYAEISKDGQGVLAPLTGTMASVYGRVFTFVRGGLVVSDIFNNEHVFIRLFDFLSGYAPQRTVALPFGGGILVAYNAYTHGILRVFTEEEKFMAERLDKIIGPSVLVYVTPPVVRIVGVFGARITSMERVGRHLILGMSTMANVGALNATPIDGGYKEVVPIHVGDILKAKEIPLEYALSGSMVLDLAFGGIPLYGYKNAKIVIRSSKKNEISVMEYNASLSLEGAEEDQYNLKEGRNEIDLSSYSGIVSFKLKNADEKARIRIVLG